MLNNNDSLFASPLKYSLSLIGGKWKALIIWHLAAGEGAMRYSDLKRSIPYDISHKVLSQQLKELTRDEVIIRTPIVSEQNPNTINVEYSLTEKGLSLCNIIYLLNDWGMVYGGYNIAQQIGNSRGSLYKNMIVYKPEQSLSKFDTIVWINKSEEEQAQLQKLA